MSTMSCSAEYAVLESIQNCQDFYTSKFSMYMLDDDTYSSVCLFIFLLDYFCQQY